MLVCCRPYMGLERCDCGGAEGCSTALTHSLLQLSSSIAAWRGCRHGGTVRECRLACASCAGKTCRECQWRLEKMSMNRFAVVDLDHPVVANDVSGKLSKKSHDWPAPPVVSRATIFASCWQVVASVSTEHGCLQGQQRAPVRRTRVKLWWWLLFGEYT